ncbi:MAG TPA: hypothetical protein PK876_09015 [Elusimicrobiota bacterium]|nr:hypothetical protein [Elusimicrobiota bacterium]
MRLLFFNSHNLHSKVTLPLALFFADSGHAVTFMKNRPDFMPFGHKNIINNPTCVDTLNRNSLRHVANQIGYLPDFDRSFDRIVTSFIPHYKRYDAVIATTKDLHQLRNIHHKYGVPCYALGYQHLPLLVRIGQDFISPLPAARQSILFGNNPFADEHGFNKIFDERDGIILSNFTYLDRIFDQIPVNTGAKKQDFVLVFHPGGYRNVITEPGASQSVSYQKQRDFLMKICPPLYASGLKVVIKIHPLHARYHGLKDMEIIVTDMEKKEELQRGMVHITDQSIWGDARTARFLLTFGSSSIYELWAAGIKNVFVGNFFGQARSGRFSLFPDLTIDTLEQYAVFIRERHYSCPPRNVLTQNIINAYADLFDGKATSRASKLITADLT